MSSVDRRTFAKMAAAFGATAAFGDLFPATSSSGWRERRDLFPEGVASGDPDQDSVLLWTRCPQPAGTSPILLTVEVAEDSQFSRVVAQAKADASSAADWTSRVLVGGLHPAEVYW